jgi:hypothetical protein
MPAATTDSAVPLIAPLKKPARPAPTARHDDRFDYLDKLPSNVPPIEHPLSVERPSDFAGPAEATYYFPIAVLPRGQDNATGVFFPAGFAFPAEIDVILYFHGHKAGEFNTINEYWSGRLHNLYLRENINATGKKAVLIAPTLGASPGSGINADMGIFANPGGADVFLAEVVKWIGKYVPQYVARRLSQGSATSCSPAIPEQEASCRSRSGPCARRSAKSGDSTRCMVRDRASLRSTGKRTQ